MEVVVERFSDNQVKELNMDGLVQERHNSSTRIISTTVKPLV